MKTKTVKAEVEALFHQVGREEFENFGQMSHAKSEAPFRQLSREEFHKLVQVSLAKFQRLPKAKKKALLIEWDILNPDGSLRRYPMDHVPLGPRA